MPRRGAVSLLEIGLFIACIAIVAMPMPQNLRDVVVLTFLYAGLALAWNIAGGYAGLISFGHAAFFGIGAYTSTILFVRGGLTPWIGLWIGALTCAAAGALLAVICARLKGPFDLRRRGAGVLPDLGHSGRHDRAAGSDDANARLRSMRAARGLDRDRETDTAASPTRLGVTDTIGDDAQAAVEVAVERGLIGRA